MEKSISRCKPEKDLGYTKRRVPTISCSESGKKGEREGHDMEC
jgi:hypothetical protein